MPRRFYRIVQSNPPTREDFVPKPPRTVPRNPEKARLFTGLSMYATLMQARRRAAESPWLGTWIAEVTVPDDSGTPFERTTTGEGHYTLWGDPALVLSFVSAVFPASV